MPKLSPPYIFGTLVVYSSDSGIAAYTGLFSSSTSGIALSYVNMNFFWSSRILTTF